VELGGYGLGVVRFGLGACRVQDGFGCLSGVPSLFSLTVHKLVAWALICGKRHKPWSTLFGVIAGSFLGKFQFLLTDVHDCDQSGMYLGREQTAFMHHYINC
jgi:hypothetical protein